MDPLDLQILRELLAFQGDASLLLDRRGTNVELARRLGADRTRIGVRLRALSAAGAFLPWRIDAQPQALGISRTRVVLRGVSPFRDEGLMRGLLAFDGVKAINEYGSDWGVVLYAETPDALDRAIDSIASFTLGRVIHIDFQDRVDARSRPARSPKRSDLRILAKLVGRTQDELPAASRALGITTRSLRRHLASLAARGVSGLHFAGDATPHGTKMRYAEFALSSRPRARAAEFERAYAAVPTTILRHMSESKGHVFFAYEDEAQLREALAGLSRALPRGSIHDRPWTDRRTPLSYFAWLRGILEIRSGS